METKETVNQKDVKEAIEQITDVFEHYNTDPIVALCALKIMVATVEKDLEANGIRVNVHAVPEEHN